MSLAQQVFAWLGAAQGFALFGTLLWRRHYRRMPLFVLYVGGVQVFNVVYALHPTWETYMLLQIVAAALRFGLALELTNCIFGAFPAAAVTARRVMLLILVATVVTALTTAPPDGTPPWRPWYSGTDCRWRRCHGRYSWGTHPTCSSSRSSRACSSPPGRSTSGSGWAT
jgi:hypothetical protein